MFIDLNLHFSACNRTYDTDNGRILNPSYPYYSYSGTSGTVCDFGIHVPNPQSKISAYFKHFYVRPRRGTQTNCTETQYLKVLCNLLTGNLFYVKLNEMKPNET